MAKLKIYLSECLFIVLAGIFLMPFTLYAAGGLLRVYPSVIDISLAPNQEVVRALTFENNSDLDIPIEILINSMFSNGEDLDFQAKYYEEEITVSPKFFILKRGESQKIEVALKLSPGEKSGKYFFLLLKTRLPQTYFKQGASKIFPQIGIPILIKNNISSAQLGGIEIAHFNILQNKSEKKQGVAMIENLPATFSATIINNLPYHVKPKGELILTGLLGQAKISFEASTLLPGAQKTLYLEFDPQKAEKTGQFFIGKYQARLELKESGAKDAMPLAFKNIFFWVLPWKKLSTGGLAGLMFLSMVKYKRRLISAAKSLKNKTPLL